jgi:hypothetical protein
MVRAGFKPPEKVYRDRRLVGAMWASRRGRRTGRLYVGLQPDGTLAGGFERAMSPREDCLITFREKLQFSKEC